MKKRMIKLLASLLMVSILATPVYAHHGTKLNSEHEQQVENCDEGCKKHCQNREFNFGEQKCEHQHSKTQRCLNEKSKLGSPIEKDSIISQKCKFGCSYHRVNIGTPVVSACAGEVKSAGREAGTGYTVCVEDSKGNCYYYGGMQEALSVKEGDRVKLGTQIGLSGNSGMAHRDGELIFYVRDKDGVDITEKIYKKIF